MAKTKHIHQRMSQRGINAQMIELVKLFGIDNGDKTILNTKAIDSVLRELGKMSQNLQKMRNRRGIVVVEAHGTEITTYQLEGYKPSKIKAKHNLLSEDFLIYQ